MKLDSILTQAARLARKSKFDRAIKILLPEITRYNGSFIYYYLLGLCYLYAGIYSEASTYLTAARKIKLREPSVLLAMATLHLKRGDTDRAVDLYLEVLDLDERNKIAKKALKVIRKNAGDDEIAAWVDAGGLPGLFPPIPRPPFSPRRLALPFFCFLLILALAAGGLHKFRVIKLPFAFRGERPASVETELAKEEREAPMQIEGSYRYILTMKQVLDAYNEARRLFTQYHDETAKVHLNRVLESNASEAVKNKARLLISYMDIPGFDSLRDRIPYGEVKNDPPLYRDCYVIWRGMVSNLSVQQYSTTFDFLVGYDTRRTLEGIVPVVLNFAAPVNPERPLEVLGRVIPISTELGYEIRLEGIAVNQAGLLDQNP
jgi:tetratricopeptide (TPR) repeat protein